MVRKRERRSLEFAARIATVAALEQQIAELGVMPCLRLLASYGLMDPREAMPRARDAANRALTINPSLARAHASLGRTTMIFDWDWRTAGWHFTRALQLAPGEARTYQWHAYFLSARGQHNEAIDAARRAITSEPLSLNTNTALGYVLYLARRYDEASAQLERTLEIDPDFAQARRNLALVRVQQHRFTDAVTALGRVAVMNSTSRSAAAELAWAEALAGNHAKARSTLADLDRWREHEYVPPDAVALIYAGLGAKEEAIGWLQRAFALRIAWMAHLSVEPMWHGLRDDPRVQQMIATIHPQ